MVQVLMINDDAFPLLERRNLHTFALTVTKLFFEVFFGISTEFPIKTPIISHRTCRERKKRKDKILGKGFRLSFEPILQLTKWTEGIHCNAFENVSYGYRQPSFSCNIFNTGWLLDMIFNNRAFSFLAHK